jgi:hypothetical protein
LRKKTVFIILLGLASGVLLMVLLIYWLMQPGPYGLRQQAQLTPDHQLLCEVLKPGMSEDEVLSALHQVGDFTMSRGEWGGGLIEIGINFTDPKLQNEYGPFDILFINYEYMRAGKTELVGGDGEKPKIICDFYQSTESITSTP